MNNEVSGFNFQKLAEEYKVLSQVDKDRFKSQEAADWERYKWEKEAFETSNK